jgi:glyoxylase-like metal-dependent hydrolase (beta-lactamase superfamily II)/rhodanese-related sulfurtransferase
MMDVGVGTVAVVDQGLGNSCYLLDLGDGSALVVDPPRDLRAVRAAADRRGLRIRFAADTHLHADFLSGAVQLAHDEGATVLASLSGRREFPHRGLVDGEEVDLGGLTLATMSTPGHTDEHVSYVVLNERAPVGVFTGGSMIVGSAARTDLLGADRAEELARAQYDSLQRLAMLPGETAVWPTHGAGSFCSAPASAERTSTVAREIATNPLLAARDVDTFVRMLAGSLGSYPPYFLRLAEINRQGPDLLDTSRTGDLTPLPALTVRQLLDDGALMIDVRPVADYATAHVTGALSIALRDQFATWLGWLAPLDVPLVVVRNADQNVAEVVWQALKIGYDNLAGELAGGMETWIAADQPTMSTELITVEEIADRQVIDIRQLSEFSAGHLPTAANVELGAVTLATDQIDRGPTVVMCGHGERAASAASVLERKGQLDVAILAGGAEDWARATGRSLDTGS